ncbi:FG-GAP repeat domain-containing protein [Candidatus Palauibacter sp.]|uniref:FG-GAP repeat domain-containing protein n=1 Tax=Candidatus Palauibacter sp. TaxID=3101350 RepID=UPI003AF2D8CA
MTNAGGRTRLWLNDGAGRFTDATDGRMPATLVRFSWDLELVDVDNDFDLDALVSCKRCAGSLLFRNDGTGAFQEDPRALPQYTNNYEFEAMDLDGDADFLIGSLSGPDRLLVNDGAGRLRAAPEVFEGEDTPGTLGMALADLDGDARLDVVMSQGEHPTAGRRVAARRDQVALRPRLRACGRAGRRGGAGCRSHALVRRIPVAGRDPAGGDGSHRLRRRHRWERNLPRHRYFAAGRLSRRLGRGRIGIQEAVQVSRSV